MARLAKPVPPTLVTYQILPLGTLEGHKKHLRDLGHDIPFEAPR